MGDFFRHSEGLPSNEYVHNDDGPKHEADVINESAGLRDKLYARIRERKHKEVLFREWRTPEYNIHLDDLEVRIRLFQPREGGYEKRVLPDGTVLRRGDKTGELHYLYRFDSPASGRELYSMIRKHLSTAVPESLSRLARLCEQNDPKLDDINVFYGTTSFGSKMLKKFGFAVGEIADVDVLEEERVMAEKIRSSMQQNLNDAQGDTSSVFSKTGEPHEAYITRDKLIERYGSASKS